MMSIRLAMLSLLAGVCLAAAAGCEITTCEDGAVCTDEDGKHELDREASCVSYCGRLSVCGAPQANDFDACVESCEERFERLPDETAQLCECAEYSRCEDVLEGRCSDRPGAGGSGSGTGGTSGCGAVGGCAGSGGGGAGSGGSPSGGGSGGSASGSGGAPNGSGGAAGAPGEAGAGGACAEGCDCTPQ